MFTAFKKINKERKKSEKGGEKEKKGKKKIRKVSLWKPLVQDGEVNLLYLINNIMIKEKSTELEGKEIKNGFPINR